MATDPLGIKLQQVQETLRSYKKVLVAFSGGVDSTLLAKLARDVLGKDHVLAVTADSPSIARTDLQEASQLALKLDLQHEIVATHEVSRPAYRANTPGRCYVCKYELFEELEDLAKAREIPVILYGAIGDDLGAERPGQQAARERGIQAPLQDVGLSKPEIRELAKRIGLPNWNRPQNACLASRIPHGTEVSEEILRQIEDAEAVVKAEGFRQVRVRHHGVRASIEVGIDELPRLDEAALRSRIVRALQACGYAEVDIDPAGYRSRGAEAERPTAQVSFMGRVRASVRLSLFVVVLANLWGCAAFLEQYELKPMPLGSIHESPDVGRCSSVG